MSIPASQEILKALKKKEYKPIYFLSGEEPYFIDMISNYIENNVLDEGEKAFNQTVVYGRDIKFDELSETLKRFPMMAEFQVIILKEAQSVQRLKEQLTEYLQAPVSTSILVVCFKYKKTKDKKFINLIKSKGVFFEGAPLRADKVPSWIHGYLRRKGLHMGDKTAYLLVEHLGTGLSKIANELEKLSIILPEGTEITDDHIEEHIGISKEYNTFELVNAVAARNVAKANRIINYFGANKKNHPMVLTIATLYAFFSKILAFHYLKDKSTRNAASELGVPPFWMNDYITGAKNYRAGKTVAIIDEIRTFDMRSKGVGNSSVEEGELQKELIYKIMH